jgi:hypothetical protein
VTHYCDVVSFLFLFPQEIRQYITHASYTDPVNLEDSPLAWWKQHGHLFPTLSRLARRYLATPATSCPVERLFSVAGQVDAAKRASLSSDNLTLLCGCVVKVVCIGLLLFITGTSNLVTNT